MDESNKTSLFRKKSEEYINSPEKLDNYLHVTNPGVWILLLATIILLSGVCVWGIFGKLNNYQTAALVVENGSATCLVPEDAINDVIIYHTLDLNGTSVNLNVNKLEPIVVSEDTDVYALLIGNLQVGSVVYPLSADVSLEDGVYSVKILTEKLTPMSLLTN